MIVKKIISTLVLILYLHGMSGYTMSFHKCNITGFENVYTGFGLSDPCTQPAEDYPAPHPHFERGSCCNVEHTIISVDDDSYISYFKTQFSSIGATCVALLAHPCLDALSQIGGFSASIPCAIKPPELCSLCVFRI